jgi:hypothetical protein
VRRRSSSLLYFFDKDASRLSSEKPSESITERQKAAIALFDCFLDFGRAIVSVVLFFLAFEGRSSVVALFGLLTRRFGRRRGWHCCDCVSVIAMIKKDCWWPVVVCFDKMRRSCHFFLFVVHVGVQEVIRVKDKPSCVNEGSFICAKTMRTMLFALNDDWWLMKNKRSALFWFAYLLIRKDWWACWWVYRKFLQHGWFPVTSSVWICNG